MTTLNQRSFSGGEISPFLYARVDVSKYPTGLRTCRNFYVLRHGGVSNRPGSTFVCETKWSSKLSRLLKFEFNAEQTYQIEMGEEYFRFIKNGSQVRLSAKTITGITQANPAVVTSVAHGYADGDEVYIYGVQGMTQVLNRNFKIDVLTADTFALKLMDGTTNLNSTGYSAYTSGGSCEKVYEIANPYQEDELADVKFVQSADIITMVHSNHPPAELARINDTNWTYTPISLAPDMAQPTGLNANAGAAGAIVYKYKVTAIDAETFEESLPGLDNTTKTITGISQANPAVVTSASHGFANGDEVYIQGIAGMTEVNGQIFTVANQATNTFELEGIDSSSYAAYVSGGSVNRVHTQVTSAAPTATAPNVLTWGKVLGAREYNIYRESNGLYGLVGIAVGDRFKDVGLNPDTATSPPNSRNPFIGTGNYPSSVTYIQQRLGLGNTDNDTEKIWLSRTGNFKNFTTSSPLQSDDAITFNMSGSQVNAVKHMLDIRGLVVLTSGGEFKVTGGNDGPITPTTTNVEQQSYNGAGNLSPLIVNGAAIYQQARGSIVRDLGFDYQVDGYAGNDLTIFSSHLFDNYVLKDWAYQQIPHSIVWACRDDGVLLGMTYVREQQLIAWHRHDFHNGEVESVSCIPEANEDVLYLTIKRTINGSTKRYIEKFNSRSVVSVADLKFMDANLTYDGRNYNTGHTMTLSGGTTWEYLDNLTLTSSQALFKSTDVGNTIAIYGPSGEVVRCKIKSYTSSTVVTVNPHKTVPEDMRSVALNAWDRAVDQVVGLWHLEGQEVSVFADGFVVASPNNSAYVKRTITNGTLTLDKPYGVIHVGLPITSDLETLDIDTLNGESLVDKNKIVQGVALYVESSRGIFAGGKEPEGDDPLLNLLEIKPRNNENYDDPVSLKTKPVEVTINNTWNDNGRVFVRQVDPIPLTILSVAPIGKFPFRG